MCLRPRALLRISDAYDEIADPDHRAMFVRSRTALARLSPDIWFVACALRHTNAHFS